MQNINIIDFLTKLEANLNSSINTFESINKSKVANKLKLYDAIQKNSAKMYKYLECLKQLEYLYFTNDTVEKNKFLLSFDIDSELYDTNFKKRFKDDNKVRINLHKMVKETPNTTILEKTDIDVIETCQLSPNKMNLPIIKALKDIPPMFYWYDGDAIHKKGIYTCLSPGFVTKVPFPSVVSTISPNFKTNTSICKYETKELCLLKKKQIADIHNSEVRICSYVHRKEKIKKIGSLYRCVIDTFGNYDTLSEDMNNVNIADIKKILMYSLSDSLLTTLWYQNKFNDGKLLLSNLDTY